MKKSITILGAGLAVAIVGGLTSCHDDQFLTGGEGLVKIQASVKTDIKVSSRATAEELGEKCLIHISNPKGLVREYKSISEIPAAGIKLVADNYVAEAWAGDSVSASFDARYYKGREEFTVRRNETSNVELSCKIANVATAVKYDDNIDEFMKDYSITVGHSRGTLDFEGRDTRWGYFMMPNADKDLTWTLTATLLNGESYTRTGVITAVKPTTLYTINIAHNGNEFGDLAGGYLTITVDESEIEINDEIIISMAPLITGKGFDIDEELIAETGKVGRRSVYVSASTALSDVILESDDMTELTGIEGKDFNLMTLSSDIAARLEAAGINWFYDYDDETGTSYMKINFEDAFTSRLLGHQYRFNLIATDTAGKTSRKTLTINCGNAPVVPSVVNEADVWATKTTLVGRALQPDMNPGFLYRVRGTQAWTTITEVNVEGDVFTAELNDLQPGTTYEYTVSATDYTSSNVMSFTTEAAAQLPNASFEDWHSGRTSIDSKDLDLIYAKGGQMFWDSGNHGSITMSKNVTTRSTKKVHAGEASAELYSQFVGFMGIGKLAAGNIFIGQYLETIGTNGALGWGRPWASRPKAITAWVHYTPVAVTHADTNPAGVKKGDMDTGIIYVAILDDSTKDYKGTKTPVIVNTDTKEFFSKDDANVIAYGEYVISEATPGDAMIQITIPLTYFRTDVKASNILLTASASRYGDYFTGGDGSILYLDDIQLVY